MRFVRAFAFAVTAFPASAGAVALWDTSCLNGGRTVYAERFETETEAKTSAGQARTRFPEAICIVSDATPSEPAPFLDEIRARSSSGPPGPAQDDLMSALTALSGGSVPTAPPLVLPLASDTPPASVDEDGPLPAFVLVVPDPLVEPDHVRVAVYENVPIGVVVSDFERIRSVVPALSGYVPMIETSRTGRTFVDVGPVAPLPIDEICASLETAGTHCTRSHVPAPTCARTSLPRDLVAAAIACRPPSEPGICPLVRFGAVGSDPLRDVLFLASTIR